MVLTSCSILRCSLRYCAQLAPRSDAARRSRWQPPEAARGQGLLFLLPRRPGWRRPRDRPAKSPPSRPAGRDAGGELCWRDARRERGAGRHAKLPQGGAHPGGQLRDVRQRDVRKHRFAFRFSGSNRAACRWHSAFPNTLDAATASALPNHGDRCAPIVYYQARSGDGAPIEKPGRGTGGMFRESMLKLGREGWLPRPRLRELVGVA